MLLVRGYSECELVMHCIPGYAVFFLWVVGSFDTQSNGRPGKKGVRGVQSFNVFHDMFVYWSGLRREQGTKNQTLIPQDPQSIAVCKAVCGSSPGLAGGFVGLFVSK